MSSSKELAGEVRMQVVDGSVAVVTLARPGKLNALTMAMTEQLASHIARLNDDDVVRAVVLTGSGRSFCVGSDIAQLETYKSPWAFGNRRDYGDVVRELRKPCIASVNGYAFGGGLELALSCDIRLAGSSATFAAPEIKLGWVGGSGQCALLSHSVGPSNAAYLVLTGEAIDAATALSWGLVTEVVPDEELPSRALVLARAIAQRAPIAAQAAKIGLRAPYSMPLLDALSLERHLQTICFATGDANEGRLAFAEKRAPSFEGS